MTDKEKAVVMAYTGIAMLVGDKIGVFYEYVSNLLGHAVYTHELADKSVWEQIKEKSKDDFLELCRKEEKERPRGKWIDKDDVTTICSNCRHLSLIYGYFCPFCGADMRGNDYDG